MSSAVNRQDDSVGPLRMLYMILSPRSLPYANLALRSLFQNCIEPFHLALITDTTEDKETLTAELSRLTADVNVSKHSWAVFNASDIDEREGKFSRFNHLLSFRRGHPCWRKITDPLLLASDGAEMILLDPDIYFPNRFRFEQSSESALLLMWQKPCCLFPPEVVQVALDAGIPLAHHVDIGVAQWRSPVDLEWLDWLVRRLGDPNLPRSMHVESIVWAALAMRVGGGYLDPRHWLCWHRTQFKRLLLRFGANGTFIIRHENLAGIKCFHAGGEAKWWLPEADKLGILDRNEEVATSGTSAPFVELTSREFQTLQRHRHWARRLGYYSMIAQT
jgi:hypothetical protein